MESDFLLRSLYRLVFRDESAETTGDCLYPAPLESCRPTGIDTAGVSHLQLPIPNYSEKMQRMLSTILSIVKNCCFGTVLKPLCSTGGKYLPQYPLEKKLSNLLHSLCQQLLLLHMDGYLSEFGHRLYSYLNCSA